MEDLGNMVELVSYTATSIDNNGYMESLGATQTALVKREAGRTRAQRGRGAKEGRSVQS